MPTVSDQFNIFATLCPNSDCNFGKIIVHNAYDENPLVGKEQPCDVCGGKGYLAHDNTSFRQGK